MANFIIGVAGGSGSGKSTVTEHIIHAIGRENVAVIVQDNYYKDLSHISLEQRKKINFDHPDAFDWELMIKHLNDLHAGVPINMPVYNFAEYTRSNETTLIPPTDVIVFEGIFALAEKDLRDLMSLRIFVDTASDIRFIRRLKRDTEERGRTVESVIQQYMEFVRPMHKKFVDPTKRYAHIIIPHGANKAALEMIVARINAALNNEDLINSIYFEEE